MKPYQWPQGYKLTDGAGQMSIVEDKSIFDPFSQEFYREDTTEWALELKPSIGVCLCSSI